MNRSVNMVRKSYFTGKNFWAVKQETEVKIRNDISVEIAAPIIPQYGIKSKLRTIFAAKESRTIGNSKAVRDLIKKPAVNISSSPNII